MGKEKLLAIGVYPHVALKDAREKRDEAKKLLAAGVDPGENRKAVRSAAIDRSANSFEVVALEWIAKHSKEISASYMEKVASRLKKDAFPHIGAKPIADIQPQDILKIAHRIEGRGALESAHRIIRECGQVFRYAVQTGRLTSDPTRDLKGALPAFKNQHFAAYTEPADVAKLLRIIDLSSASPIVKLALKLAPLVFVRPGELRTARWADIDLEKAEWRFTASKTGIPHIVPLSRQAVEILREVHLFSGDGAYVFPNARTPNGSRPMSDAALLVALRTMGVRQEDATVHGFRATARTMLDEQLGFRIDLIEAQLAHSVADPLGRAYNRTSYLAERKEMMQAWSDYLDELRSKHQ